jgi:UDP-glucose 4-epimerase
MNLLITGGAGYIGYSLINTLIHSYNNINKIVVYDNLFRKNYAVFVNQPFKEKPIEFIRADILDNRRLEKAMKDIDIVVHLAAHVTTPFADHDAHFFDQINHWGTAQVVQAAEEANVKHFIYLSSASVYGSPVADANEDYIPHPTKFYGISKYDGERQVQRLSNKMKIHILRAGNVYGYNPSMRLEAVVNRFMFNANFNEKITIQGTGEQKRPFIHVDKLAYIIKELTQKTVPNGIYNIAEYNFSINEVADFVKLFYPDLESISINFNMQIRGLTIELPVKITDYIPLPDKSIMDELLEFKNKFAF